MNCAKILAEAIMSAKLSERDVILDHLNTIARELTAIRRALLTPEKPKYTKGNFTGRLLGCLGSESIANYDFHLDWQRFVA